jgi:plasmid stability protein
MAQLVIRNVNEEIKQRLKRRALLHGTSMEAEARLILRNALTDEQHQSVALGSKIAARFADIGLDESITEIHQQISPAAYK